MSRRATGLVGGCAAALLALTACGGTPPAPPPTTVMVTVTVPVPVTVTAPPAGADAAVPAEAGRAAWTMPDLVGQNLQDAQNAVQALTDFAITLTRSHDATGAGREQVLDRNWRVCSQNVPPGRTITPETEIDFGAVKTEEDC